VDLCGRETLTNWGNIRASTNPGAVQMPQDPDVERLVFGVRHEGLPLVRLTSLSWGWSPREGCSDAQEAKRPHHGHLPLTGKAASRRSRSLHLGTVLQEKRDDLSVPLGCGDVQRDDAAGLPCVGESGIGLD
jgi:hypothetical protein